MAILQASFASDIESSGIFAQEASVPLCVEDLEVGDRVYSEMFTWVNFGTVTSVSPEKVTILMDQKDGNYEQVITTMEGLTLEDQLADFYKALNFDLIEVGSVLSQRNGNKRQYATVEIYTPNKVIFLRVYPKGKSHPSYTTRFTDESKTGGPSLERKLYAWELEG